MRAQSAVPGFAAGLVLAVIAGCAVNNIYDAARTGNKIAVRTKLERGADVNASFGDEQWTPLHVAAFEGHDEMVRLLISNRAYVNPRDVNGNTPLHLAAEHGHDGTVRALIQGHADLTIRNDIGQTPRDLAGDHPEINSELRAAGG